MATMTRSNPADVTSQQYTALLNKAILDPLHFNLVIARLKGVIQEGDIPQHSGTLTMRMFKRLKANTVNVTNLTDGDPTLGTPTEVTSGKVDISLTHIAETAKQSWLQNKSDLLNWWKQIIGHLGENAAKKYDEVVQAALLTGTANSGRSEVFSGVNRTASSTSDWNSLAGVSNSVGKATLQDFNKLATWLNYQDVPMIAGQYVAAIQPPVQHDLWQDSFFRDAMTHGGLKDMISDRTIANTAGIKFVGHTGGVIETGAYGTWDTSVTEAEAEDAIFTSWLLGARCVGAPKLGGTNNPAKPSFIVLNDPDKADPAGQYKQITWTALYGSKAMKTDLSGDVLYYGHIRSKSTFLKP